MKRKNFYREGPLAVVFLALLLMAGPASAQTPTAAEPTLTAMALWILPTFWRL